MKHSIRRATADDVEELAPLFDSYRQFYRKPSDLPRCRAFLGERLRREQSVVYLALDPAGAPVGFVQLYPSFSSASAAEIWILNDLFVLPQARRSGVGTALLDAARAHAVETGAIRIVLSTERTNEPAQTLYERHGYVRDDAFYAYSLSI